MLTELRNPITLTRIPEDIKILLLEAAADVSIDTCTSLGAVDQSFHAVYREYKCSITVPRMLKEIGPFLSSALTITYLLALRPEFKTANGYISFDLNMRIIADTIIGCHQQTLTISHAQLRFAYSIHRRLLSLLKAEYPIYGFSLPQQSSTELVNMISHPDRAKMGTMLLHGVYVSTIGSFVEGYPDLHGRDKDTLRNAVAPVLGSAYCAFFGNVQIRNLGSTVDFLVRSLGGKEEGVERGVLESVVRGGVRGMDWMKLYMMLFAVHREEREVLIRDWVMRTVMLGRTGMGDVSGRTQNTAAY